MLCLRALWLAICVACLLEVNLCHQEDDYSPGAEEDAHLEYGDQREEPAPQNKDRKDSQNNNDKKHAASHRVTTTKRNGVTSRPPKTTLDPEPDQAFDKTAVSGIAMLTSILSLLHLIITFAIFVSMKINVRNQKRNKKAMVKFIRLLLEQELPQDLEEGFMRIIGVDYNKYKEEKEEELRKADPLALLRDVDFEESLGADNGSGSEGAARDPAGGTAAKKPPTMRVSTSTSANKSNAATDKPKDSDKAKIINNESKKGSTAASPSGAGKA